MGTAFGGGIVMSGDICGAVTGAIMLIGLKFGAYEAGDMVSKNRTYKLAEKFINEFRSLNKSTKCRDLLGFDIKSYNNHDKEEIIFDRCPGFLEAAVEIIEKIIGDENDQIKK
jgi:C_GCAxxG_C_C family probable redox protein